MPRVTCPHCRGECRLSEDELTRDAVCEHCRATFTPANPRRSRPRGGSWDRGAWGGGPAGGAGVLRLALIITAATAAVWLLARFLPAH